MRYQTSVLALAAIFSSVQAHGTIESAIGESGESKGFKVDDSLARNCTGISPCQQDTTIIRDSEITQNIVNSCGRTEIDGNIDVGGETEKAIAANKVTTVQKGSQLAVTIHQVNADGAGPYECDLDVTSNAATNFVKLQVSNNVPGANGLSQAEATDFTINVQMPDDFNCVGASTGDICTVRCRNTAMAGPFGGCFPVQQTDGNGRANNKTADSITTAQTLDGINKQVAQNKKDLPAAIAAIAAAGAVGGSADASRVSALVPAASQTAAAGTGNGNNANGNGNANANGKGKGKGNGRNGGNGNGNAANAGNANAGNANAGNANAGNANAGNANAANGNAANAANGNAANAGKGKGNAGNANAANGNAANGNAANGNAANAANGNAANAGKGKGNAGKGNAGNGNAANAGNSNGANAGAANAGNGNAANAGAANAGNGNAANAGAANAGNGNGQAQAGNGRNRNNNKRDRSRKFLSRFINPNAMA